MDVFYYESQREATPGRAVSTRYLLFGETSTIVKDSLSEFAKYLSTIGPLTLYRARTTGVVRPPKGKSLDDVFEGLPVLFFNENGSVLVRGASGESDELYQLQDLIVSEVRRQESSRNLKELGISLGSRR